MKRRCVLLFLLNLAVSPAFTEDVTLTTYYPAPYGEYKELTTTGKTLLATDGTSNVGIGTTAPTNLLHAVTGGDTNLAIESTSGGGSVGLMAKNADRAWFAQVRGDLNDAFAISDTTAAQYRLLIDRFGNVGIGTTAPATKLEVAEGSAIKIGASYLSSSADYMLLAKNGYFTGSAWIIPDSTKKTAVLLFEPDASIVFYQTATAGAQDWQERLRINSAGDVAAPANVWSACQWTADSCGTTANNENRQIFCPNGYYAAGFNFWHGAWDYGIECLRAYCCSL